MTLASFLGILFAALSQAAILALVTFGIVLIFRTSLTTNFAQGSIGALTAFFVTMFNSVFLATRFPAIGPSLSVVLAIMAGIIYGFLIGLFVDIVLVRNSRFPNPLSKQMITMGIVLVITGLIPTIYSGVIDNPPTPQPLTKEIWRVGVGDGEVVISVHKFLTIVIAIVVISTLFFLLKKTKWGLGVRATASNEAVASMMGVNTRFITAMSWAIAAAVGSLAAALYAPTIQTLSVNFMVFMQVNGFLSAVLGGFTTFIGPVVGAILIPVMTVYLSRVAGIWNIAIAYFIILLIVLIKPAGLFGKRTARKV